MQRSTESRGAIALALGILSFVTLPFVLGLAAWVVGAGVVGSVPRDDPQWQYGHIGRILGIINVGLCLAGVAFVACLMMLGVGLAVLGAA